MRAGLGALRLSPAEFWGMTPRELDAALRGALGHVAQAEPMIRQTLNQLMQDYPDKKE